MSSRVYLTPTEQKFLIDMLEISNPIYAAEEFAIMMAEAGADPQDLEKYVKLIMKVDIDKYFEALKKKGK